jgi:hypothetical protein
MAVVTQPSARRRARIIALTGRKVSVYERFAGSLITLLIVIGVLVVSLIFIWLAGRLSAPTVPVPVAMEDFSGGRPDGLPDQSMQVDAPDYNEVARETDVEVEEPLIQETVALVVDAVALRQTDLDDPAITEEVESSQRASKSEGTGDAYALGEGGPGTGGVPRAMRWRIQFDQTTLDSYARQLDFFKIELAAVRSGRIEYASNVSQPTPTRRGMRINEDEKRLYFSWESGTLKKFDTQLLTKAGVPITSDAVIVQFFPPQVEGQLAALEQQRAGKRDLKTIRRTYFAVRPRANGGYEFVVVGQQTF